MSDQHLRDVAGLLQAFPFAGREVGAMGALIKRLELRFPREGMVLVREGGRSDEMYIVLSGDVRVDRRTVKGNPHAIYVMKSPSLVGTMSLSDGAPHSATVVAVTDLRVAVLPKAVFDHLMNEATPEGTQLRRLLIAGQSAQVSATVARINSLLDNDRRVGR